MKKKYEYDWQIMKSLCNWLATKSTWSPPGCPILAFNKLYKVFDLGVDGEVMQKHVVKMPLT